MKKSLQTFLIVCLIFSTGLITAHYQTNTLWLGADAVVEIFNDPLTTIDYPHHEMHEGNHYFY